MSAYTGPSSTSIHKRRGEPGNPKGIPSHARVADYKSVTPPIPNSTVAGGFFTACADREAQVTAGMPQAPIRHIKKTFSKPDTVYKAVLTHCIGQTGTEQPRLPADVCRAANGLACRQVVAPTSGLDGCDRCPTQMPEEHRRKSPGGGSPGDVGTRLIVTRAPPLGRPDLPPDLQGCCEQVSRSDGTVGVEYADVPSRRAPSSNMTAIVNFPARWQITVRAQRTRLLENSLEAKFVLKE